MGFVLRTAGFLLFAAAFVALIADGVRSMASDRLVLTPVGQTWFDLDPASLNLVQSVVQRYVHPYLWDPILQTVLLWPTFAVGGALAVLLMLVGRKRKRKPILR